MLLEIQKTDLTWIIPSIAIVLYAIWGMLRALGKKANAHSAAYDNYASGVSEEKTHTPALFPENENLLTDTARNEEGKNDISALPEIEAVPQDVPAPVEVVNPDSDKPFAKLSGNRVGGSKSSSSMSDTGDTGTLSPKPKRVYKKRKPKPKD